MRMRFNDGMTFDTSGPLRVTRRRDGYYVTGQGMLIPVEDRQEGRDLIKQMEKENQQAE